MKSSHKKLLYVFLPIFILMSLAAVYKAGVQIGQLLFDKMQ